MTGPTASDAWQACDRKDFAAAAEVWERLIQSCSSEPERDALRHGYGYALVGLKRFEEARALYTRLFEKTGSHVCLHQLGMVEREAGEFAAAAAWLVQERGLLSAEDTLAVAANLYEQGLVASHLGFRDEALAYARRCLGVSLETDDEIMRGCAYRLLGDLSGLGREDAARGFYGKARSAFEAGGDPIACAEIDERLASIA